MPCVWLVAAALAALPEGFVYLHDVAPTIIEELRYATAHNFVGRPLPGYKSGRCILTDAAAAALAAAQQELVQQGFSLKVYDCYRPQKTVNFFVSWSHNIADQKMKAEFYPRTDKTQMFRLGYLSSHSAHTRGSTVDVTLIPWPAPAQAAYHDGDALMDGTAPKGARFDDNSIDMGTGYDVLDPSAFTDSDRVSDIARRNRQRLKDVLGRHGMRNYSKEWWHYRLRSEPFPQQSFDFDVQ